MNKIAIIDIETTGLDPERDEAVEVAIIELKWNDTKDSSYNVLMNTLTKPSCPIGYEAMGVHMITEEMVFDAPPWKDIKNDARGILEGTIPCAHNAVFERSFLLDPPKRNVYNKPAPGWIDTMLLAQRAYPEIDSHALNSLRFFKGIDMNDIQSLPHRALFDCIVTGRLLMHLIEDLKVYDPARLQSLSTEPFVQKKCKFGKYKGRDWEDIAREDMGYLSWALKQNFDQNVRETCLYYVNNPPAPTPRQVTNYET